MTKKQSLKHRLISSVLALVMLMSSLLGTTFAWFTDTVTSAGNTIVSGNLKVDLLHKDGDDWISVKENPEHKIFSYDKWEPGHTRVETLKIANLGNLALKYRLSVEVAEGTAKLGKNGESLADVIDVYVTYTDGNETSYADIKSSTEWEKKGTLAEVMANPTKFVEGCLLSTGKVLENGMGDSVSVGEKMLRIALHMDENAGNEYQKLSVGDVYVNLVATQWSYEKDSFDEGYDNGAEFPKMENYDVAIDVPVANGVTTASTTVSGEGYSVTVPAGVKTADDSGKLGLSVKVKNTSDTNLTLGENEIMRPLDVHVDGLSDENETAIIINLGEVAPKGLNIGNYTLYHVENEQSVAMTYVADVTGLDKHNEFTYDPATGEITVAMASFSEVAVVADTEKAWKGEFDYTWYDADATELQIANADQLAAFGAIVGGMDGQTQDSFTDKTVKLVSDINLGDKESENNPDIIFYPIGYNSSDEKYEKTGVAVSTGFYAFEGTFDGNGNTISNFYQNTWEMKGDHNWYDANLQYYRDGMGLFGKVYGGTVKNLTVENFTSDGEIATTGVIAAYAEGATFENIAIFDCNPRVYNIGNGGIVGCVGWYATDANLKTTFTNITVDNSNKISALWGSYDVACGGIVGQYYPTSGQSSAEYPVNAGIHFENCHVSAVMDVYNDVCGNYQYYAYRYAGMIIGSIRENTTNEDGKTIPDMTGISATGCTVNYGDWNDYYYCEFEKNGHPSYSGPDDYKFSRVPHSELNFTDSNGNGLVDADERASVTGCKHDHTDAENNKAIYLPFHQLFTGYGWGVSSIGLEKYSGIVTNLDITEGDQEESVEKFETKFTGDFLYRVGNQNTVSLGSLFAAKEGATISNSGVWVTVKALNDDMNVSGTFSFDPSTTTWTEATIKFTGTGVVKVTIQDYNFCTPTELILEVVDAVNATGATNATSNNVVLLQDCGFSSLEVSGGYTLYGNGFTMTCSSDSVALDMGYAFVKLDSGTLDNVQVVCPNFDYAALYKSNLTSSDNRSETTNGTTRYYNAKSGVMVSGNSQILNSRISGARAAVNVSGGNCVIDNSRVEGGAVASILVGAANSVTLRDVTLVQKPTASTYDSNKTLMGFSVLVMCTSGGMAAPITLEGTLIQNAWVDENDKQYVPEDAQTIIETVMGKENYLHDLDGDGVNESLNLGIAYMPADEEYTVQNPSVVDNREDKSQIVYSSVDVKYSIVTTYVYSYENTNGTADSFKSESEYAPNKQSDIITVNYSDTTDGLTTGKSFGTDGWIYELNVDLDKLSGYALDFSKLSMNVNGVAVTDFKVDGNAKPTTPVAVTAGGTTYTLTATVDDKEYTATFKVTGTETSKESPSLVASNYEAGLCVASSYGGTWHGAAPALEGIQIRYWSVAEQQYKTITLSDYTPTTAGKQNGTSNTWTYSPDNGDFTLTLTGGQVHSSNNVYAMPVVCDGKLYFVAASSNGLVNSGNSARTIPVSYSFKDNNNGTELTFSHTWSVAENKDAQYKYSDFCNGTLTKLENCITPDTLITLANGTQVRVDSLTGNEELLVWNMETGKLDKAPIMFVDSEDEAEYEIIHLYFSDGTDVKVISEHGFWDYDLNKYVYLDANAADYIGHTFAKQNGDALEKVTLVDVVIETEVTTAWSPVTEGHLCYFVNGMLSMPGGVGGLFNIFEVDAETMTYDYEAMQKDIETYGLYTYEELNAICPLSEEMFNAAGGAYLKISIGKGNLTLNELIAMINRYSKFFN